MFALLAFLEAEVLFFEQVDVALEQFSVRGFFSQVLSDAVHLGG